METMNIISAILIYLILPVILLIGIYALFRRKRNKDAGRINKMSDKPLDKDDFRSREADEAKEARHTKRPPENIDPETGRQPDKL